MRKCRKWCRKCLIFLAAFAGNTHPYTTYMAGAAFWPARPPLVGINLNMSKRTKVIDQASGTAAVVVVPATQDRAKAESILASRIEDWDILPDATKNEIIDGVTAMNAMPNRAALTFNGTMVKRKEGTGGTLYWVRMCKTFASSSEDFIMGQIDTISNYLTKNNSRGVTDRAMNEILAFVGGCSVQNEMQATIAVQMALAHDAAMRALSMIGQGVMIDNAKSYSEIANKLLRTSAMLGETLNKLQRGGTQIIKHVHVYEGGQAVVADTVHTGGANVRSTDQVHAAEDIGGSAAMLGADPFGRGVSVPGGERQKAMPDARRCEG